MDASQMEAKRTQSRIRRRSKVSTILAVGAVLLLGVCILAACETTGVPDTLQSTTQTLPVAPAAVNASTTTTAVATIVPTETKVMLSPTENATVSFQEFKAGYPPGWFMDPTIAAE